MAPNNQVIVVADDDAAVCTMIACVLGAKGFTVHTCGNGEQALSLCRIVRPAVALLDLEMPVLDGLETARRIREDPDLAGIRVIALTGKTDERSSARAWDAGFHEFLGKPVPTSMLIAMVRPTHEMQGVIDAAASDVPGQVLTGCAMSSEPSGG